LEVLAGFLIAYLNLDEVIRIIREEDEPKAVMMKKWDLSEVQVEAILNMRLRSLRRLEEMEIKREHKELSDEKEQLKALLKDEALRWEHIADEVKEIKKQFGQKTVLGKRRTEFATAPEAQVISIEAFVEKEPITILLSEKGWIKTIKGHNNKLEDVRYKEGDAQKFAIKAYTTDKLLVFATDGRFFTLNCDKLPGGKSFGEPIRLWVELDQNEDILSIFIHKPEQQIIIASSGGNGFRVLEEDIVAQTKNGKQVLNLKEGEKAAACKHVEGDTIAVLGDNRKLVLFPVEEIPVMKKGQGVKLQAYKDGGLADIKTFNFAEGLSWQLGGRARVETDLLPWKGKRGQAGRLPPVGFPRTNRFD
jgi:topoisomerase-4 subunit A